MLKLSQHCFPNLTAEVISYLIIRPTFFRATSCRQTLKHRIMVNQDLWKLRKSIKVAAKRYTRRGVYFKAVTIFFKNYVVEQRLCRTYLKVFHAAFTDCTKNLSSSYVFPKVIKNWRSIDSHYQSSTTASWKWGKPFWQSACEGIWSKL